MELPRPAEVHLEAFLLCVCVPEPVFAVSEDDMAAAASAMCNSRSLRLLSGITKLCYNQFVWIFPDLKSSLSMSAR